MNKHYHIDPRLSLSASILVGAALIFFGFSYYNNHHMSAIDRYRDQSHDRGLISQTNNELDASMKSGYTFISPRLDTLGLHMQEPVKSVCGEGDPSLYKYDCFTEALIDEVNR